MPGPTTPVPRSRPTGHARRPALAGRADQVTDRHVMTVPEVVMPDSMEENVRGVGGGLEVGVVVPQAATRSPARREDGGECACLAFELLMGAIGFGLVVVTKF